MCIGLPINYLIKIKSKVAELYSLSKLDFTWLGVVFKDYMESFLDKSLLLYKDFMINYHRVIWEYKEMNIKVKNKLRKKNFRKRVPKSSNNVTNFKFRQSIFEGRGLNKVNPYNEPGAFQQEKIPITISPPKDQSSEKSISKEKTNPNKLRTVSSFCEKEKKPEHILKKSLSTKSTNNLQSPYITDSKSSNRSSTKSLNCINISNENQNNLKKTLTRTATQFIHDLKKETDQVTSLLEHNKGNFSPRTQNILNNKLMELKNENCTENQLILINHIEEIIKNKKNENSIC